MGDSSTARKMVVSQVILLLLAMTMTFSLALEHQGTAIYHVCSVITKFVCIIFLVIVLDPSLSVSRPVLVCPGSMPVFVCNTTEGSLLWETIISSTISTFIYDENLGRQSPKILGNFTLYRDGVAVDMTTSTATAVNSTAVLTDPVQLSHDSVTLRCSEDSDLNKFNEAVLSVGK